MLWALLYVEEARTFLQACQRSVDEWCSVCCENSGMLKRHARFYKRVRDLRMNDVVYVVSTPVCWRGTRVSTSVSEICGWMMHCMLWALLYVEEARTFLQACQRSADEWYIVCCELFGMLKRQARLNKRVRNLRMNGVVCVPTRSSLECIMALCLLFRWTVPRAYTRRKIPVTASPQVIPRRKLPQKKRIFVSWKWRSFVEK